MDRYKNLPISVRGKKKVLAPINPVNISSTSSSTKESIKGEKDSMYSSREKFEIDCDNDKKEDAIYISKLSESEKFFFEVKARDIYDFLKSINLIRFIESFINDGFETKEDLMEIQEDYFEENKSFNKNQQKKILKKAKEYLNEYNKILNKNNNKNNNVINNEKNIINNKNDLLNNKLSNSNSKKNIITTETGVGGGNINDYINNNNILNRCWTCFNKLKNNNYIEKKYEGSIVTKIVRFCSPKCKEKFEKNMFCKCDYCYIKYDKSKGDYIYKNNHFHSQECLDSYMIDNFGIAPKNEEKNINAQKEENYNFGKISYDDKYDPMNDF